MEKSNLSKLFRILFRVLIKRELFRWFPTNSSTDRVVGVFWIKGVIVVLAGYTTEVSDSHLRSVNHLLEKLWTTTCLLVLVFG